MNIHVPVEERDKTETGLLSRLTPGRIAWRVSGIALLIAAGVTSWTMLNSTPPATNIPMPPARVTVAEPLQRMVTEWDEYVGRFTPSESVEVRPRVSGAITEIHFADGDYVEEGQLLFTIDQRPFAAALAEADAEVASARSELALARTELERGLRLVKTDAVSQSRVDELQARVQASEGALAAAEARQRSRRLDLEFTEVRAPISGRVSDRRIDRGNLVGGGGENATLLTTINAVNPIYFTFESSEGLYLKALRDRGAEQGVPVEVRLQDETRYAWRGTLDFTDNQLDPHSGTIRGRATFDNPEGFLTAGMFGNMRLSTGGTSQALLIPEAAVLTDQARKMVLTVDENNIVAPKPVVLGPVIEGLRIIHAGLTPEDRVIIAGIQSAAPGALVAPNDGSVVPEPKNTAQAILSPISAQATFAVR